MGMCKKCNEVYTSLDMKNGYCKECYDPKKDPTNNWMDITKNLSLTDKPKEPMMNQFLALVLLGSFVGLMALFYQALLGISDIVKEKKDLLLLYETEPIIGILVIVIFVVIIPTMLFIGLYKLFKPSKKREEEYTHNTKAYNYRLKLNEEFKNKFIILKDFDESKYINIKNFNVEERTQEKAMYKIYAHAEAFKADAIILNSSNIATHVHGSVSTNLRGDVSGGTSSSNTFHFTATLVKKKDIVKQVKNKIIQQIEKEIIKKDTQINDKIFCSQCGTKVKSNDKFCINCGHKK